jgi:hypothetical protein
MTSSKLIYKQVVVRSTEAQYTVTFRDPYHLISGIACFPRDDKTAAPEIEVVDGGVSHKHVNILLSPLQEGTWSCCIQIFGVPDHK